MKKIDLLALSAIFLSVISSFLPKIRGGGGPRSATEFAQGADVIRNKKQTAVMKIISLDTFCILLYIHFQNRWQN